MLTLLFKSLTETPDPPSEILNHTEDADFDDNDNDENKLMTQPNGLIRLREDTGAMTPSRSRIHRKSCDDIARFTEESLHSFGFTQPLRDQNTFEARRNVVTRSFDFMKKLRDRLDIVKLDEQNPLTEEALEVTDMKRPA